MPRPVLQAAYYSTRGWEGGWEGGRRRGGPGQFVVIHPALANYRKLRTIPSHDIARKLLHRSLSPSPPPSPPSRCFTPLTRCVTRRASMFNLRVNFGCYFDVYTPRHRRRRERRFVSNRQDARVSFLSSSVSLIFGN